MSPLALEVVAQSPSSGADGRLAFSAASVRFNRTGEPMMLQPVPGGVNIVNAPLRILIRNAYGVQDRMIIGSPDWPERFDIVATSDRNPTMPEMSLMLRSLLEDRFKLRVRDETRDVSVFALRRGRDGVFGPNLERSSTDCATLRAGAPPVSSSAAAAAFSRCGFHVAAGKVTATGVTMRALASSLSNNVGRTVIDATQASGEFDLELSWEPEQSDPSAHGSLFAALEEQLGLKLEAQRVVETVLVIESVERPIED